MKGTEQYVRTFGQVMAAVREWMETRAGVSMELCLPPETVVFAAALDSPVALELVARDAIAREFCRFVDERARGQATMHQLAMVVRIYGLGHSEISVGELAAKCHQIVRGGDA